MSTEPSMEAVAPGAAGAGVATAGLAAEMRPPNPRPSRVFEGADIRVGKAQAYLPPGIRRVWPTMIRDGSVSLLAVMMSWNFAPVFRAICSIVSPFWTV